MPIESFKEEVNQKKKHYNKVFKKLERIPPKELDRLFHENHDEVFEHFDCLTCANCCKTTGPLLTDRDIQRLSKHLGQKPGHFTDQYLRIDEDGDYVFKSMPCPFLGDDNYCSVYESRPKACREYPHTDRVNMKGILKLTKRNLSVCPAVMNIVDKIERQIS